MSSRAPVPDPAASGTCPDWPVWIQNRRHVAGASRQTRLEQLAAEKHRTVSAGLMRQCGTHLEKTCKSITEQRLVNNGSMVELQERGIRAYEGLGQILSLNELIAKMPVLSELFAQIEAARVILEKIAKINKMLK